MKVKYTVSHPVTIRNYDISWYVCLPDWIPLTMIDDMNQAIARILEIEP